MSIFTIVQKIFDDHHINYSVVKKDRKIKVNTPVQETIFCKIVGELSSTFGDPKYVDLYYGYIWSANNRFVSFNVIETGYNNENMYLYIFKKLPFSKKIDYTAYVKLDTMIAGVLEEYNFFCDNFIHCNFIGREYLCFGHSTKHECIISLKRNRLNISILEKQQLSETTHRTVAVFSQKFKVKKDDLSTIRKILSECFSSQKSTEK